MIELSTHYFDTVANPLQMGSLGVSAVCLVASFAFTLGHRRRVAWALFCIGWLVVGVGSLQVGLGFFQSHISDESISIESRPEPDPLSEMLALGRMALMLQEIEVVFLTASLGVLLTLPRRLVEGVLRAPPSQRLRGWVVCGVVGSALVFLEMMRLVIRRFLELPLWFA